MAIDLNKANRIIFQPTKTNSDKLRRMAEQNNVSISFILNQLIENADDSASMNFGGLDTEATAQLILDFDVFKCFWNDLKKTIEGKTFKPFSECTEENKDDDIIFYNEKKTVQFVDASGIKRTVIAHPIIQDKFVMPDHHDIISEWNNYAGSTFAVEVEGSPEGKVCGYTVYGLFMNKPVYKLYPEWDGTKDGWEAIDALMEEREKKFGRAYVDIFNDPWCWQEEHL